MLPKVLPRRVGVLASSAPPPDEDEAARRRSLAKAFGQGALGAGATAFAADVGLGLLSGNNRDWVSNQATGNYVSYWLQRRHGMSPESAERLARGVVDDVHRARARAALDLNLDNLRVAPRAGMDPGARQAVEEFGDDAVRHLQRARANAGTMTPRGLHNLALRGQRLMVMDGKRLPGILGLYGRRLGQLSRGGLRSAVALGAIAGTGAAGKEWWDNRQLDKTALLQGAHVGFSKVADEAPAQEPRGESAEEVHPDHVDEASPVAKAFLGTPLTLPVVPQGPAFRFALGR
jgi:hypothetical protein